MAVDIDFDIVPSPKERRSVQVFDMMLSRSCARQQERALLRPRYHRCQLGATEPMFDSSPVPPRRKIVG